MEKLLKKNEGPSYWVLGDRYTFKLTGKDSGGNCMVMDQVIRPESGPPPHVHQREDETFYILEGRFSFLCGDREEIMEAGSFVYIPRGTLHTFRNVGMTKGRLLVTVTPAGLEDFFYQIGTIADGLPEPPPFDPAILGKLVELAGKYGMEIKA
jgi:mannose-6-phosphate isomerase-like protein (cupin superfamily)